MKLAKTLLMALLMVGFLFLSGWNSVEAAITTTVYGIPPMQVAIASCSSPDDIFSTNDALGKGGNVSAGFFCLTGIVFKLFYQSTILLAIAFFLVLIVGGLRYLTAGGDEKAIQTSQKTLTYGVMGMGIAVGMVFLMIVVVNNILQPMDIDDLGNPTIQSPFQVIVPDYFCTRNITSGPRLLDPAATKSYCQNK